MNNNLEILHEEVVYRNGSFKKIKQWVKGKHPHLGIIINGYTGIETVIEKDVIVPHITININ